MKITRYTSHSENKKSSQNIDPEFQNYIWFFVFPSFLCKGLQDLQIDHLPRKRRKRTNLNHELHTLNYIHIKDIHNKAPCTLTMLHVF